MKKPDRFEREASKYLYVSGKDLATLLRKEHRLVIKLIEKRKQEWEQPLKWVLREDTEALRQARAKECTDILAKLKERVR